MITLNYFEYSNANEDLPEGKQAIKNYFDKISKKFNVNIKLQDFDYDYGTGAITVKGTFENCMKFLAKEYFYCNTNLKTIYDELEGSMLFNEIKGLPFSEDLKDL